ncbi:myristylated membrane protein [Singapore grouper iridovirus]|nr:myristylated membrane protein [Singapore grouper iridovirus]
MGAAQSVNGVKIVTNAYAEIMTDLAVDQDITADQTQVFSIDNVSGDVYVEGTVMTEKLVINLASLMKAVTNQSSQDELIDNIAQQAQAAVSGLNFAQFAFVTNNIDRLITACVKLSVDMRVSCTAKVEMTQSFSVSSVMGDVRVKDVRMEEFSDVISTCALNAAINNAQLSDIVSQIKQRGDATATGLNPMALLAAVVLAIVGLPLGAGFLAGRRVVGPLMMVAGMVGGGALAMGYVPEPIKLTGFAPEPDLTAVVPVAVENGLTLKAAISKLTGDSQYGAVYWQNYKVTGTTAVKLNQTVSYYAPPNFDPVTWTASEPAQKQPSFRVFPTLFQGQGLPKISYRLAYGTVALTQGPERGDVYLDSTTGNYYVLKDGWKLNGTIPGAIKDRPEAWGIVDPNETTALTGSERYTWVDPYTRVQGTLWYKPKDSHEWVKERQDPVPINVPLTETPSDFNVWVYKDATAKKIVGWVSAGAGAAGAGLTASAYFIPSTAIEAKAEVGEAAK